MSLPSPNFQQLRHALHSFIAYQESKLNILQSNFSEDCDKVDKVFRSVFDEIGNQVLKSRNLSDRDIELLSESMNNRTNAIVASPFFRRMDAQDQEKYLNIMFALKEELHSFRELAQHQAEINEKGLGHFLDQPWAWKALEQLAKAGNFWAIQTLRNLIHQKNNKACLFLIYNCSHFSDYQILDDLKNHLTSYLQEMLDSGNQEDEVVAYIFIETILKKQNWSWGQKKLEESFDTNSKVASILRDVFLIRAGGNSSLYQFILEKMLQDHPLAIDMVANIFSDHESQAEHLVKPLIQLAIEKGNVHFDMLVLSLAAMSDSSLCNQVEDVLDVLETKHNLGKQYYDKILNHLIAKREELCRGFEVHYPCDTNIWANHADFVTARTYQLFALRLFQLIEWLEGGQVCREAFLAISDCFPKTKAVIVGDASENAYFYKELSRLLAPYQITVYSTLHKENQSTIEFRSDRDPLLRSDRSLTGGWIRDYFFASQHRDVEKNMFHYPYWRVLDEDYCNLTLSRLEDRFADDPDKLEMPDLVFSDLGVVADSQSQLNMLSYLLNTDSTLTNHQFQFTYNEGGNCLIGESEGKPYALIGKNALDINKMSLIEELEELDLRKDAQGKWIQVESQDDDDDEVYLTDKEMKLFFAKDLGVDPSRIYFVEQASYHLDTAMAILEDKTIILNDSMLAYEIMKERCEKEHETRVAKRSRGEILDSNQPSLLEERLDALYDKSKKMKLVEDAAQEDLVDQGFKVIRLAGVFEDILKEHPENHATNLFNFLSLTTPDGKKVILALGCSLEHQNTFRKVIAENIRNPVEIHFLDQNHSESLLTGHGGIHCITKCLPCLL